MKTRYAILAVGAALALVGAAQGQSSQGDPAKGQAVFEGRCDMCHNLGGPGQGPDLIGVVGRKAATSPDFNYSQAMSASGLTWTPQTLDRFLTDPSKMLPDSPMQAMVPDPAERRDLIAYLASLKAK